jgi:DNA-binding GntR family transcriptional regulator
VAGADAASDMTPSSVEDNLDTFARYPASVKRRKQALIRESGGVMYAKTMVVPEPPATIVPLRIESVVDHVYAALRERILAGDLPRGMRLRQASLAEELGVSRTPLREALRRLSTEGLVEFSPNRGATVSELDFGDMRHAWAARVALEPGAARLAAERRDAEAIARLRRAIAAQRASHHDREAGYAANREFHLALAAASGNPHLTRFAQMLWVPRIGVPIYEAQAGERAGTLAWAEEHERIADAVAAGDAGLAEHLTRTHVAAHPPVGPAA